MKVLSSLGIIITIFAQMAVFAPTAFASSSIAINEFMPHPAGGSDWVELYNFGSTDIDLTNWQLNDGTSAMKTLSGTLAAGQFLTVEVSNRLNNSGDNIILLDNTAGQVDSTSYASDPGTDKSIGRLPDGTGGFAVLTQTTKGSTNGQASAMPSPTSTPTPQPTTTSLPTQTSPPPDPIGGTAADADNSQVSLSEYLPAPPSGQNEWVELYNASQSQANVGGWKIDDEDGGSSPFTIPADSNSGFIPPKSYKTYIMPSDRFNNSGDHVRLLRDNGSVVEDTSYTSTQSNVAYAKDTAGNWQETTTLTPNEPNIITPPQGQSQTNATPKPSTSANPILGDNNPSILGATNANADNGLRTLNPDSDNENLNDQLPALSAATQSSTPSARVPTIVKDITQNAKNMLKYIIAIVVVITAISGYSFYTFYWKKRHNGIEIAQ